LLSASLASFASNEALRLEDTAYSYQDLDVASGVIASKLSGERFAVLGERSFETFASIVATVRSGRTYIPLNSEQPDTVLRQQLALARPDGLIVDRILMKRAEGLLAAMTAPPLLFPLASEQDLLSAKSTRPSYNADQASNAPLYEMLTSGTTGKPKRIAIPRSNVANYLASIKTLFDFGPDDRFSQFFKLTFDLSVHDMLVAWTSGGCLIVPSARQLMDPVKFAKSNGLSVWFSVPSLGRLAMMSRRLTPNALPRLRHALFCGEALPCQVASEFAKAAPNAVVTNLYGPTEATIAITWHRLGREAYDDRSIPEGSVPIGRPFAGQEAVVVDHNLQPLPDGQTGELMLGGSQLAPGYCDAPAQTASSFLNMRINGSECERWYRTGDLVCRHASILDFKGRRDTQVKFRGHRIELGEIEAALADEAGSPLAAVIPSYQLRDHATIDKLIALVASPQEPIGMIRMQLNKRLPAYMVPAEVIEIPADGDWWNQNGKVDRRKLEEWYASRNPEAGHD
jgi:amino acid adenylation domain-containing protein